jgi:diguanylate cyclase (GGDEF)-like protein/PAS domain S-box-containing protein
MLTPMHPLESPDNSPLQARTFRALYDIAVAIAGVLDWTELARLVTYHVRELLDADGAVLHVWDEDADGFQELSSNTLDAGLRGGVLRMGQGIAGQAALHRSVLVIEDYPNWAHAMQSAVESGLRSALAAPLVVGDRVIGVLAARFTATRQLTLQHESILTLLAAQVAPALDAVRLYAAQTRLLDRERALREVSRVLASDLDESRVLELAVSYAAQLLDAPYVRIWLLDDDGNFRCAAAVGPPSAGGLGECLSAGSASLVAFSMHKEVVNLADGPAHVAFCDKTFGARTGLHGYLAVPIRRGGVPLGVLEVLRHETQVFGSTDEHVVAGLADAVAIAVANARSLASVAASELRLRSVYSAIACGILVQDAQGVILHANAVAEEIVGYRLDQMLGRPSVGLWKTVDEDGVELEPLKRRVLVAAATGVAERNFTSCIIPPNGQRRWLMLNAVPVTDADGRVQVVSSFVDITERKRAEDALAYQTLHDDLTGLPNRVFLHDRLDQTIRDSRRDGGSSALLLMDLDHFKEINDTLGHHSGDELLRPVGVRLRSAVRSNDTVARLGGDEFAILLPGADLASAQQVARKLLEALQAPVYLEGRALGVNASIGIALSPMHGDDADVLLRRADVAMYVAKRAAGGHATYAPELDMHSPNRLLLMTELRNGIDREELVLHYQPKVDLRTGRVSGVEALMRWRHPTQGLLAPDHFIPQAEQSGLIGLLSRWLLGAVVHQSQAWSRTGRDLRIAANLSMRDLHEPGLVKAIADLLADAGVEPGSLQLELTESTLMSDPRRAIEVLTQLRAQGVQVAIDDFGTGYSSLALLKSLPVDTLKIDRSFVRDVATDDSDLAIVRATISLAHSLGLLVVAEGIEDAAACRVLTQLGCDEAQGYYFSRPLPTPELEVWLADRVFADAA